MDVSLGLLDRQCNPRPIFTALRCLNTVLFRQPNAPQPLEVRARPGLQLSGLQLAEARAWLVLPDDETTTSPLLAPDALDLAPSERERARWLDLGNGRSHALTDSLSIDRPILITVADNPD